MQGYNFLEMEKKLKKIISLKHSLPENVFLKPCSFKAFFDFELLFRDKFIKAFVSFIRNLNDSAYVIARDVSTDENYEQQFLLELTPSTETHDIKTFFSKEILSNFPLYDAADRIILFSDNFYWSMYCDRDFELCIALFHNENIYQKFSEFFSSCENELCSSIKEAISGLYLLGKLSEDIKEKLIMNY